MKSKKIKISYSTRYQKRGIQTVPKIQIEGKWLEELGFSISSTINVEYENGSIRIRPLTTEEETLHRHQALQSEIKQKSRELNSLQERLLSQVADVSVCYGNSSPKS